MSRSHGSFVWFELMTSDPHEAESFYHKVIGPGPAARRAPPPVSYTRFAGADGGEGGRPAPAGGAARPGWLGYVAVDDVDVGAGRAIEAGGLVRRNATDIPGVGRFAVISDPQGGTLALFKPLPRRQAIHALDEAQPSIGWHELHTADRDAALRFYAHLFGWTKGEPVDLGDMGIYQMFVHDSAAIGGMITQQPTVPAPFWLFYFAVESISAAMTRVRDAGGQVVNGPHQVPGGSWVAHGLDPQGGLFALVAQQA
jgi:predicted enzyme related to lactoylglutathione lyase